MFREMLRLVVKGQNAVTRPVHWGAHTNPHIKPEKLC
ncbi:hypothetical protein BH09ACT1_BH09ACT1_24140 [soil metagenome]